MPHLSSDSRKIHQRVMSFKCFASEFIGNYKVSSIKLNQKKVDKKNNKQRKAIKMLFDYIQVGIFRWIFDVDRLAKF